MWYLGIDLHRLTVVMAGVNDAGEVMKAITIRCEDTEAIRDAVKKLGAFRAVIEASGTYRWLYDLLRPYGTVVLAHPLRLRAMVQRRSKTDKLDAQLLANLLRINQIPLAYIPPEPYQQLRDLTRCLARLRQEQAVAKIKLRALLARQNRQAPYRVPFGVRGIAWFRKQDFGPIENLVRDELLERLEHYRKQLAILEAHVVALRETFPQVEVLMEIHGIGLYSALLIVGELGEVDRFHTAKQVGRLCRPDGTCQPVRRPLLPRLDYAARLSLAALDPRGSGDEGRPGGRGLEELLHAGAEAFQREDRAGGGGPQTGGDMLETAASLATGAEPAGSDSLRRTR